MDGRPVGDGAARLAEFIVAPGARWSGSGRRTVRGALWVGVPGHDDHREQPCGWARGDRIALGAADAGCRAPGGDTGHRSAGAVCADAADGGNDTDGGELGDEIGCGSDVRGPDRPGLADGTAAAASAVGWAGGRAGGQRFQVGAGGDVAAQIRHGGGCRSLSVRELVRHLRAQRAGTVRGGRCGGPRDRAGAGGVALPRRQGHPVRRVPPDVRAGAVR
eukprot:ctg_91.g23